MNARGPTRERYLSAVVTIQQMLLERTAGSHFANILPVLGSAAGADRCYYFECREAEDGTVHAYHVGEWCRPHIPPDATVPEVQDVPIEMLVPDVYADLGRGMAYNVTITTAVPAVAALMQRTGTRSILVLPILVAGRMAGCFGFDNCAAETVWRDEEVDLLRAAATAAAVAREREFVEARLLEANDRLQLHFEQTPLAVIEWDREHRVMTWSRRAEEVFGWPAAEVFGKTWSDWLFVHAEDEPAVAAIAHQLILGATPFSICRNRNYTKAGQVRWCEWYNSIVRDATGAISSTLSLVLDVTERVRTEGALARANARSAQAEKMAALGQMAAGIAHDFNNALTIIIGKTELLLAKYALADKARATANDIREAGIAAADTVRKMRQFVHGQSGMPWSEQVDLVELVRQMASKFSARPVNVTVDQPAKVRGNPAELQDVLSCLLTNAHEAMPAGAVVKVSVGIEGHQAYVRVTDSGCGMDADTKKRCFDPFFTTKGVGHSGLGLAVCWAICKRHEGELTVESTPGQNTAVTMWLPSDTPPAVPAPPDRSLSVLVIDDQPEVLETLEGMLRFLHHRPTVASSGAAGLQALGANQFDLVVTDFGMPEMNGLAVAGMVKAAAPHVPVVLLTGWGDDFQVNGHRPANVDRIVAKPLSIAALQALLTEMYSATAVA